MMLTNLFSHLVVLGLAGEIPTNTPAFQDFAQRRLLAEAQKAALAWRLDRALIQTNKITYFNAPPFPEGPTTEIVFESRYCFRTWRGGACSSAI